MTTEEQRDYWEERYNIEKKKNEEIAKHIDFWNNEYNAQYDKNKKILSELKVLLKDMRKNGSNHYGDKLENIINNN